MKSLLPITIAVLLFSACGPTAELSRSEDQDVKTKQPAETPLPQATGSPDRPNLQRELLDERFRTSNSRLDEVDFKNHTYPLPRGWQNPDGSDLVLMNGRLDPIYAETNEEMSDDVRLSQKQKRRIGASYVTTRYFDVTGDGTDEAIVILKIETTGSAIPQLIYIFTEKEHGPELIWYFRTGDRADGGLKDLRPENGQLVVELFGQDRFLLGETETGKLTGDEEQICCPTHFTRTRYKWNGRNFLMQGKRLTFSVMEPDAPPVENMAEMLEKKESGKK